MASHEHLASSDFIKSVHQKLREEAKVLGAEEAWQKHCKDEENLKKYATEMHNLATNCWENNYKGDSKASSRVEWTSDFILTYFTEQFLKHRRKEIEIAEKIDLKINVCPDFKTTPYRVLDVGSCYNPFQKHKDLDVVPIDIAPATSDVYKCDFLNIRISSSIKMSNSEIIELQSESFDAIVFSLLLEYLPSPNQRLLCCEKAYDLLKLEGILIIITPDSKHVGANAKIMKSWRYILAKIGFSRIKYEKLIHLHCMVFRKSLGVEIPQRWANMQDEKNFHNEFVIPQDFKQTEPHEIKINDNISCEPDLFNELPNF